MSAPSTSTSHSNFASIFNAALETYKHKTKRDLSSHPLLPTLQPCDSAEAILTVLREHIPTFSQSENGDNGLTKWVAPTVDVLYSFSATLGGAVGLVSIRELVEDLCSNDYLLGVPSSKRNLYGHWRSPLGWYPSSLPCETCLTHLASRRLKKPALAMISLLNFLTASNIFFCRLEIYTGITPTTAMMDMIIEIMTEVLTILAIATKEVKRGRLSELISRRYTFLTVKLEKYIRKLAGNTDIEDSLVRLDKLTQEEARMASAELLKMTSIVDGKVMGVDDRVNDVQGKVQDVRGDVQGVHSEVQDVRGDVQGVRSVVQDVRCDVQGVGHEIQGVDDKVQGIGSDVKDIGNNVKEISGELRGVEGKLDQVNCLLSFYHLLIALSADALTAFQGTNLEIVFSDGFRPQIHLSIITLHPKFITTVQFNGFFKAVYRSPLVDTWKTCVILRLHNGRHLIISCFYSGFREKCHLVRPFSTHSAVVKLTSSIQFLGYTRYHGFAQRWESIDCLLLF